MYFLAGIPAALIVAYIAIVDFRKLFYLLLFFLPLSTEIQLPGGFGTDLPTEPLMVGLMGIYILYVIRNGKEMSSDFVRHPMTLLLLLHVGWIFTTTITSDLVFVSFKYALAKVWYVVVFYFMAGSLLKKESDIKNVFWVIFLPLTFTILTTLVRHSAHGFSFDMVHKVLWPFHRNHVNYAAMLALFFPFIWLAIQWYPKKDWKRVLLIASLPIFLVGIYLSFTRAAYGSILIALVFYYIIRFHLVKPIVVLTIIATLALSVFMLKDNTYLDFAPNFERTVSHKSFDNLVEATFQMEDISTMERVYRWVAGGHMSNDNPWFGFGPGNFVNFYKSYTVTSFKTYVSRNEDLSGIHSYYLMTLIEQGIIGMIIFFVLSFYMLIKGETIYHQTTNLDRRRILLMALLCIVVIDSFLIINDLIETDKIGPFFFISMAIIVNVDLANRREAT
jgi:O-antigen ligase